MYSIGQGLFVIDLQFKNILDTKNTFGCIPVGHCIQSWDEKGTKKNCN